MIKVARSEMILPMLLLLISFLLWKHIPSLQFVGEGFYYFSEHTVEFSLGDKIPHDMFARLLFTTLPHWFGSSVHLYMWFLFLYMLVTNLAFYIAFRIITKNRAAAFFIAFLFSTSYVGQYDMYSIGGYQYFVQRGAILLPLLFSFMFFILYFTREFKAHYFAISLALYIFAIIMGFFGTWFLPPFIFYPFFYWFFNLKRSGKLFLKTIWTPLPFLVINIVLIKQSNFIPGESLFEFILNRFWYVMAGILQQLAVVTPFLEDLLGVFGKGSLQFQIVLVLTALLYIGAFIVISRLSWQTKVLGVTGLVSLIIMLLFNAYLNSATVLNTFGSSRYFYFPLTMVAIFWGLLLAACFSYKKNFSKALVIILLLLWVVYNKNAIEKNLKADEWLQNIHKITVETLRFWSKDLKDKPAYVYHPLGPYGSSFAFRFFSHPDGKFIVQGLEELNLDDLAKQKVSPERLYVLYVDTRLQIVVDKTQESRELLRSLEKQ